MKGKIAYRFLFNYILMFFLSIIITIVVFILTGFANDVISKNLMKNYYTAEQLMQDNYLDIPYLEVIEDGGGVQVINSDLQVVLSKGIDTINAKVLTETEWTEFLSNSKEIGTPYSYSISYNEKGNYWLIVTFPTSIRIDVAIAHNELYVSRDTEVVWGVIVAVIMLYLLLLALVTVIYARITSISFVKPLKLLYQSAKQLEAGDYSARVEVKTKGEIGELGEVFNLMAKKIEDEIALRVKSEANRKQLILDISHDLKNPLSSILGYAEQLQNPIALPEEKRREYIKIIYENGIRLNGLINDLFEFSKLESGEYRMALEQTDLCEFIRTELAVLLPILEASEFSYDFIIPEKQMVVSIDKKQLDRVIFNLIHNAVRYNPKGTNIRIEVVQKENMVEIKIKDNGIGISREDAKHIFNAFYRVDSSRNSEKGGTGLGLAIAAKIINAHGGTIELFTAIGEGCEFVLTLPFIEKI